LPGWLFGKAQDFTDFFRGFFEGIWMDSYFQSIRAHRLGVLDDGGLAPESPRPEDIAGDLEIPSDAQAVGSGSADGGAGEASGDVAVHSPLTPEQRGDVMERRPWLTERRAKVLIANKAARWHSLQS
jgi:hypothetical protein